MKKLALATSLATLAAGSAFAQSSVTLYGRVNTSIERQRIANDPGNEESLWIMQNNSSRFGFRGSEELGDGLKAFFQLEHGFGSDDGRGSSGFSRDAYVGINSTALGQLKLGKFTTELYYGTIDWVSFHNHDTGTSSDDILWQLDGVVMQNGVQYVSPSFGGVVVTAMATAGEGTQYKTYELSANYDAGPLHVGGGYAQQRDPGDDFKDDGWALGGSYALGAFTVGLNWEHNDRETPFDSFPGIEPGKRDHYRASVMWTIDALELHLNAGKATKWHDIDGSGAVQYTAAYNYNLSKRTKIYGFYTKIANARNGAYFYGDRGQAGLGDDFRGIAAFGIRHNF